MKRAAWPLAGVLAVRQKQEKTAALAAAEAAGRARAAAEHVTALDQALDTRPAPAGGDATALRAALITGGMAAADLAAAAASAQAQQEAAAVVRRDWTAAAQRTKALERLKERHAAALAAADAHAEERLIDDLVSRSHALKGLPRRAVTTSQEG